MKEEDLNTSFFHKSTCARHRRNTITSLIIRESRSDSIQAIRSALGDHFATLFNKPPLSSCQFNWDDLFPSKIPNLKSIEGSFREREIRDSVFSLPRDKSPGPDGFPLSFYQHFLELIMEYIFQAFHFFFQAQNWDTLKNINQTFIILISKKVCAEAISDYRPISLLNSNYKILAKCLASRLSFFLINFIDDSQCAFLKRRNISDCLLVAQETLHFLHSSKAKGLMIKLDFEKAFDHVNWDFLLNTLANLGFGTKWIS